MKIVKYYNHFRGRRRAASLAIAEDITTPAAAVVEKKFKRKALLIGIQQVREEPAPVEAQTPLSAGFTNLDDITAKLKRAKTKFKAKKSARKNALKGPHRDAKAMKQILIELYHYDPADIVMLIDDDNPDNMQPTKENIMEQMRKLVEGAVENDRFFFHFSGHSTQEETDDVSEEDRKNEFIITSDGKRIKDDILKATLVDPLPAKSSLIAVFDSCHSGTLLDLKHFRCNRVYVPWINKGHRRTASLWNTNNRRQARVSSGIHIARMKKMVRQASWRRTSIDYVLASPRDSVPSPTNPNDPANPNPNPNPNPVHNANGLVHAKTRTLSIITDVQARNQTNTRSTWLDSPTEMEKQFASPIPLYCDGRCRENDSSRCEDGGVVADVISLSSAKDSQKSWEDKHGHSMTQSLVAILRQNPHPTFHDLLTLVSHDIHGFYVDLHSRAREYKKQVHAKNDEIVKMGKKPKQGDEVEMNNFQDPQLSSDRPLDMSRHFYP